MHYEYKVIPAPQRGDKVRGARTTEDRFAQTLTATMNAQARDGWEYVRSETLPSEERAGFTKRRTVYVNLLVFRRQMAEDDATRQKLALTSAPSVGEVPRLQVAA